MRRGSKAQYARFTDPPDSLTLSSSSVVLPGTGRADSKSKRRQPTYWQSVATIGMQVADALEYAHKQGIRHRDVKPSNLLLDTHGTVWVTDFGLAKADDQQNLTDTGDILGTLRYMPPEAFEGKTDARSDVYSLGLTLYEMLAFRPAFDEKDRRRLIKQVTDEEPLRLGKRNRQLPRDLETIVHKAIDKDAKARYASAGEFSDDLQRFIEDEPIRARKVSQTERLRRWCRRHPAVAVLTTTVTMLLLILAVGATITAGRLGRLAEKEHALRTEAEKRNEELARQDYSHRVALAFHDWQGHQVRPATALLEGCPVERRGWEWAYCQRLCHLDFLTLPVAEGTGWPTDPKAGLTFSPDGRRLAVLGAGGQLNLWDSATGRVVQTQSFPLAFDAVRGNCLVYHPDGRRLVVGCEDGAVRLFDAVSGEVRALAGHAGAVRGVAVGSRGERVASAGSDGTVRVWDLKCGDAAPLTMASHARGVVSVALSPDEDLLASAGFGSTVELWDAATGRHLATLDGHEKIVYGITFSPDGRRLASASWDKTIRLWDVAAREHVMTLYGHTSFARAVAFTPDGHRLVSVGEDKAVRLWDAHDGRALFSLAGHTSVTVLAAVHPDGRRVATTSWDGTVKLWDITNNPEVLTLRHDQWVAAVALAADGSTLATASGNRFEPSGHTVRLWDAATGRKQLELPHKDETVERAGPQSRRTSLGDGRHGSDRDRVRRPNRATARQDGRPHRRRPCPGIRSDGEANRLREPGRLRPSVGRGYAKGTAGLSATRRPRASRSFLPGRPEHRIGECRPDHQTMASDDRHHHGDSALPPAGVAALDLGCEPAGLPAGRGASRRDMRRRRRPAKFGRLGPGPKARGPHLARPCIPRLCRRIQP